MVKSENREVRVINRNFSLGEYDEAWTKIERYLFIEIYNVIKEFYLAKDDSLIESFSDESITVKLPVNLLDKKLFNTKNRSRQLMDAADGLMDKRVKYISLDENMQYGFDFIAMFPRIRYVPSEDKQHMYIRIPSEIYEEMVPIESYAQLDLLLLSEFNSGNTIRLYEVFKSYAFRKKFELTLEDLRKKMGFFEQNSYKEWKYFNSQVLKPAVQDINNHKQYDIEVTYKKTRGSDVIYFTVITHNKLQKSNVSVLSLDAQIDVERRKLNMIQEKYVDTVLRYCSKQVEISNDEELKSWIVSDLIRQQQKQEDEFSFKKAMNAISNQIRKGKYKEPYSHKHLKQPDRVEFDQTKYDQIKKWDNQNELQLIRDTFTDEELIANKFGYLLDILKEEGIY